VGKLPEVAMEYGITGIPTTIIFVNGKPVGAIVGLVLEDELEYRVRRVLLNVR